MQALSFLFSPSGRLRPQPFIVATILVYLAGAASHWLTRADVLGRFGPWPFAVVQGLLIWIWFALHAKRRRDAGRPVGAPAGIGLLYALSVVLLIILAAMFFIPAVGTSSDANASAALGLIVVLFIVASLQGAAAPDLSFLLLAALTLIAFVPTVIAVAFSAWTATRPSADKQAA